VAAVKIGFALGPRAHYEMLRSFGFGSATGSRFPDESAGVLRAYLHQCRTVCRRVEREVLRLSREELINDDVIKYLNRLSDLFFVLARWISHQMGEPEYLWQRGLDNQGKRKK
jgi:hypothetical protein